MDVLRQHFQVGVGLWGHGSVSLGAREPAAVVVCARSRLDALRRSLTLAGSRQRFCAPLRNRAVEEPGPRAAGPTGPLPLLRLGAEAGAAAARLFLRPEQSRAALLLPLPPHPQLQLEVQPPLGPPGEMGHAPDGGHQSLPPLETLPVFGESVLGASVHLV